MRFQTRTQGRNLKAGAILAGTFLIGRLDSLLDGGQGLGPGDVPKRKTPVGALVAWYLATLWPSQTQKVRTGVRRGSFVQLEE